jgi:hypothetical protein
MKCYSFALTLAKGEAKGRQKLGKVEGVEGETLKLFNTPVLT